jgi:hypothetical protein
MAQPTACSAVTSDGTATSGTVAKFTTDCNIENSLIRDNGAGVAVGGTAPPGALLDVQYNSTATEGAFGTLFGQRVLTTLNPAANSSAYVIGAYSDIQTPSGNTQNFSGESVAIEGHANFFGTGTVSGVYGLVGEVGNWSGGTLTGVNGLYVDVSNASTGTITNAAGVYVGPPGNWGGGTFTNYYGLLIAKPTAATNNYSIYSLGGLNFLAGPVGLGTSSPTSAYELSVGGLAISDGWLTYSSRRWKSNIHTLHGALGKIEHLRGVEYTYTANGQHEIGMIAEEVGKVVPEVVSYEENGKEARGIDYARLTALLVEAVKQQQSEIQQEKRQIRRLEAKIRRFETSNSHVVRVAKPQEHQEMKIRK